MRVIARESAEGCTLRFEEYLEHPVERVWAYLTQPAKLPLWLAPGSVDPAPGGQVTLSFTNVDAVVKSTVTNSRPPMLLEYPWTTQHGDGGPVRWELFGEGEGTRLVLTHILPGPEGRAMVLSAWHTHLELLSLALDGNPAPWSNDRWRELHELYTAEEAARAAQAAAEAAQPRKPVSPPWH